MKNITVTLDDETAVWARTHAAQRQQSLSRFLGELLHRTMREAHEYQDAMQRYLARSPTRLTGEDAAYPGREELHDRNDLR